MKVWRCAWSLAVFIDIFLLFVCSLNLVIFRGRGACLQSTKHDTGHLVSALRPTIFNGMFIKFCRCFCQGLKMCMSFGCIPPMIFVTFLQSELSYFCSTLIKHIDTKPWYLVNATSQTDLPLSFSKFDVYFSLILKTCMWFWYFLEYSAAILIPIANNKCGDQTPRIWSAGFIFHATKLGLLATRTL